MLASIVPETCRSVNSQTLLPLLRAAGVRFVGAAPGTVNMRHGRCQQGTSSGEPARPQACSSYRGLLRQVKMHFLCYTKL